MEVLIRLYIYFLIILLGAGYVISWKDIVYRIKSMRNRRFVAVFFFLLYFSIWFIVSEDMLERNKAIQILIISVIAPMTFKRAIDNVSESQKGN